MVIIFRELERTGEEAIVAQHLLGGAEENHKIPQP
jgi:hypothetical protein